MCACVHAIAQKEKKLSLSHIETQEEVKETLKTLEDYKAKCNIKQKIKIFWTPLL
jgi:hypothetical protein